MKPGLLLVVVPLLVYAIQDDAEKLRTAKLKAVDNWVGHWKADVQFLGASELGDVKLSGELDVKWALGNTALRYDGWAQLGPGAEVRKKLFITGLLTFNHADTYDRQAYTAVFNWSEDGRTATARGDFKDKELRLDVDLKDGPLKLRVTGDNPRTIMISLPATKSAKEMDWIEVKLRK